MSLTHPVLLAALLLFPLLPQHRVQLRLFLLGAFSLIVLGFSFKNGVEALIFGLWVAVPYILSALNTKKSLIIISLIVGFIYLNGYTAGLTSLGFVQPGFRLIGLSYILFRQIDYLLNTRSEPISFRNGLWYFGYVTSFYALLAGPIQRYSTFVTMMSGSETDELPDQALQRVVTGLVKVVVISALLKQQTDIAYEAITKAPLMFIVFALLNAVYVYFNFSGYMDVVLGAAKLAGMTLPENFNKPWLAKDLVDFWSRWHMTLSSWLTDYVHNPILTILNRTERIAIEQAQIVAIAVTFLLVGLWHGSTVNYVVYAILQAFGLGFNAWRNRRLIHRFGSRKLANAYRNRRSIQMIERMVTLTYMVISFSFVGYDMLGMLLRVTS
jgi:D-alanyl-lipoteichoic acid acyltransferase DltB (MBOAT superfamily)